MDKLNDYGYVPSQEELDQPGLSWEEHSRRRKDFAFEGDY